MPTQAMTRGRIYSIFITGLVTTHMLLAVINTTALTVFVFAFIMVVAITGRTENIGIIAKEQARAQHRFFRTPVEYWTICKRTFPSILFGLHARNAKRARLAYSNLLCMESIQRGEPEA